MSVHTERSGGAKPVRCGCGGEAVANDYIDRYENKTEYFVHCVKCGICSADYDTEAEAIEAWNRAMGITHERAVEYLQSTGWMEDHDYQMMEMGIEMARENFDE